jgi:tetratricopeptide (TPR) repeat protein
MALGDVDAAEALVTRALGKDPANPGALYRKGALLNRKGRWGAALQLFNRAIALEWDYPEPWIGKGEIYLKQEKPKEALECFDKALGFDGTAVAAWLGKAQAHWALEEKDTAQSCLNRALQLAPDSPAVKEVADLFESVEEAVRVEPEELPADFKAFIDAVEPEKEETETLLQLAEMALEGGDAEMALMRYDQALQKDPRSADAWTGKGIALQYLEKYTEALAAYDTALEIRPGHDLATKWRETCRKRLEGGG